MSSQLNELIKPVDSRHGVVGWCEESLTDHVTMKVVSVIYQLNGSTPVQPPADDPPTTKTPTRTSFTSVSLSDTERDPGK